MAKKKLPLARQPVSKKGAARKLLIIRNALQIFMSQGYSELSLRNVATEVGISVGNLHYYFPNKDSLLQAMFDTVVEDYKPVFDQILDGAGPDPRKRFEAMIHYLIRDLGTSRTTSFFPELWALANHDPMVAQMMEHMYDFERDHLYRLVHTLRPDLKKKRKQEITLFISASIEGMTMFIGHDKSHNHMTEAMANAALSCYYHLLEI